MKKDRGYILNVASSAGLLPGGPYMSTYYATKAYVTSLTNAIYQELQEVHSNVHISMLCPVLSIQILTKRQMSLSPFRAFPQNAVFLTA